MVTILKILQLEKYELFFSAAQNSLLNIQIKLMWRNRIRTEPHPLPLLHSVKPPPHSQNQDNGSGNVYVQYLWTFLNMHCLDAKPTSGAASSVTFIVLKHCCFSVCCSLRFREKCGVLLHGSKSKPPLPGSIREGWQGLHHRVWPAASTRQKKKSSILRRFVGSGVFKHGFLTWFQVPYSSIWSSRVDVDDLVCGGKQSLGNSENDHF